MDVGQQPQAPQVPSVKPVKQAMGSDKLLNFLMQMIGLLAAGVIRCILPMASWRENRHSFDLRSALRGTQQLRGKLVAAFVAVVALGCLGFRLWWHPVRIN